MRVSCLFLFILTILLKNNLKGLGQLENLKQHFAINIADGEMETEHEWFGGR